MPNEPTRIEIISGCERLHCYSAEQKLALVEGTMQPDMTVSAVAAWAAPRPACCLSFGQLMTQGGHVAVKADDDVVAASRARELEQRVREIERLLGRKTMEVEILKEALTAAPGKSPSGSCRRRLRTFPGVDRVREARGRAIQSRRAAQQPRPGHEGDTIAKGDDALLAAIRQLTNSRPEPAAAAELDKRQEQVAA